MAAIKGLTGVGSLTQFQPRSAINQTISVTIIADNVPQTFPSVRVPYGLIPTLRARSTNVQSIFVALHREQLASGQGREIVTGGATGSAIAFPVDRLNDIFLQGKTGDVLVAEISGAPIG